MKNKNKIISIFLASLVFLTGVLFVNAGKASAGFGIAPATISNNVLTTGSEYEEEITVFHGGLAESLRAGIDVAIPGAEDWISFDKGKSFTLSKGSDKTTVKMKIKVPEKAEYKRYSGVVIFRSEAPKLPKDATVAFALAAQMEVEFTVIEKKIGDFEVKGIKVADAKEGANSVVTLILKNKGNISVAPTKVVMDILDSSRTKTVSSKESVKVLGEVKPFKTGEVKVEFPTGELKPGSYWAKLRVYNGNPLVSEHEVQISILEKNSTAVIDDNAKAGFWSSSKAAIVWVIIAVIVLIALGIFLKLSKKSSKKRKK